MDALTVGLALGALGLAARISYASLRRQCDELSTVLEVTHTVPPLAPASSLRLAGRTDHARRDAVAGDMSALRVPESRHSHGPRGFVKVTR